MDIVSPTTRSRMMAGIRSTNTKPEIIVRTTLHAQGFRYRLGTKVLNIIPDIVLPKYKVAIFVHGCFWHGHDCRYFKVPQTRTGFWLDKIGKNQERDRQQLEKLGQQGWRVLVVWECAMRGRLKLDDTALTERLEEWICGGGNCAQIDTQGIGFIDPIDKA